MGVSWDAKPVILTDAQLEALSETDKVAYYAHVSVHCADKAAQYAFCGAVAFGGAIALLIGIISALVWFTA